MEGLGEVVRAVGDSPGLEGREIAAGAQRKWRTEGHYYNVHGTRCKNGGQSEKPA